MSNIIVVDDDMTNVQLLQMLLELDGFAVIPCTNMDQALAAITETADAFVVDCHLERNANGIDLLRTIRQGETKAPADVIVVMSSGDQRREPEAMEAGANYFLLKPYPPDELTDLLTTLLHKGDL